MDEADDDARDDDARDDDARDDDARDRTDEPDAVEAVRAARALLTGTTPLVGGCRRLWKALKELCDERDGPFAAVGRVTGRSAEYPMPEDRHLWAPAVAAAREAELEAWLSLVRPDVMAACEEVVRRFGRAG
jgi:hypothetical protein